jgi:hypothetical protein
VLFQARQHLRTLDNWMNATWSHGQIGAAPSFDGASTVVIPAAALASLAKQVTVNECAARKRRLERDIDDSSAA